ncbi:MAG TPA: 4'-phosphopantetheinyl transferase superfamily protein [Candidatus Sabulitectum sp.]|nr:4'-phosphopantetheinyl transferase superfamily protein [Candidatus Sabulitectum sp.]HPF33178.1 4'-phosphopantetheinyl transferase superfamily protein [Candidatus Sabulitectum sp.]HPJ29620.1 4'-phosphopantetheinyl transferase superfamily protein [Candidatus Sabulitectum sp.]HPR23390.1 4'-phosphopantetheinyl transferase superfamily protein [Candidatus Sabulitectum sp.]
MTVNTGTDALEHRRFIRSITRNGGSLQNRVFTPGEIASASSLLDLAVVFSAKESVAKALGTGFRDGLSWQHIHITVHGSRIEVQLSGRASELARGRRLHVTAAGDDNRTITYALLVEGG